MRYLSAILASLTLSGAIAATPSSTPARDGAWLQKGEPKTVTSYVCAVVDLEKYLVERATTLSRALHAGKKKKQHLDPQMLDGMDRALPLVLPLMKSRFLEDTPSCDKAMGIVHDYLEKYPEMLPKDAEVIVERALLDAYTNSDEP
jgi:hypothetical protein